jgi:hypothetical protein
VTQGRGLNGLADGAPRRIDAMVTRIGVSVALVVALLGGWLWGASGRSELVRTLRAAEVQRDLLEARAALLGARVNLCNADFGEMNRQLESARGFVRRADARLGIPGPIDRWRRWDLAGFGAEIDQAQHLATRLNPARVVAR